MKNVRISRDVLVAAICLTSLSTQAADLSGRVTKRVQPVYPAIARAAHVEGAVVLHVSLAANGKAASVVVKSGPPMLRSAAVDAVKQWSFSPAATATSGDLTLMFPDHTQGENQQADDRRDYQVQAAFFPLEDKCRAAMREHRQQEAVTLCKQAADLAETFPANTRWVEKKGAYLFASRAYLDAGDPASGLPLADKAIAASEAAGGDHLALEGVYSNRGLIRSILRQYEAAIEDFSRAEKEGGAAIEWAASEGEHGAFITREYDGALMLTLKYHAKTLEAMGKADEAAKLSSEAAAIEAKIDSLPLPSQP